MIKEIAVLRRFNEITSKCPKQDTLFSIKYWFNLGGQETSHHGCKNVGSGAKHQYKQTKSTQNNKRDSCLIFAAVVCVYWYTGLPLVCYMKIFALNVNVVDEIFFQILFVWQENDLVFSSVFEKIKLKNNNIKIAPPPPTHTH